MAIIFCPSRPWKGLMEQLSRSRDHHFLLIAPTSFEKALKLSASNIYYTIYDMLLLLIQYFLEIRA